MTDKRDSKKKRKPLENKHIPDTSDKENMGIQTDATMRSNSNELLAPVNIKISKKSSDNDRIFQLRNFNCLSPEYNNRKRTISRINVDDFMTDITNENYWHSLAENDRNALASALTENRDLHNRITELEDENIRLKALLDEARSLVEVLTELLEEEGDDSVDEKSDDSVDEKSDDSIWDDL